MNGDELRAKFTRAIKIIRAEKEKRRWVFRNDPDKQAAKMAEMDELEAIVTAMKDALKAQLGLVEMEQPALIDVPKKAEYR